MKLPVIKMKCISSEVCNDQSCNHRVEHEHNQGCEYFCHFSDFMLMCKPISTGIHYAFDTLRLKLYRWNERRRKD